MTQVLTQYVPCDLCGASDHEILFSKIDPVTGMEFHLVQCPCGMAFVNPMPAAESIPLLYPKDYLAGKEHRVSKYLEMIRLLPELSYGKLLDVGCGRGDFIYHASRVGWDVEGVDLMDWDSPYNLPIKVGDFLAMDLPERAYNVVTAWALLEHVREPSKFFGKISGLLKADGKFIFVVPNVQAPGMRHACSEDIPRHLWLFTPAAVRRYLDRFGMDAALILHNGRIYQAHPFGLLRYWLRGLRKKETRCALYENKAVALLRNRQIKGNLRPWIADTMESVGPVDLFLDAVDLGIGVALAFVSSMMGNYGVMTVIACKRPATSPVVDETGTKG